MKKKGRWCRFAVALVVVGGVVSAAPITEAVANAAHSGGMFSQVINGCEGGLEIDGALQGYQNVPEAFVEEAFSVEGEKEVQVYEDLDILGYSSNESADQAFSSIRNRLEMAGWTCTESGLGASGTFTKEKGSIRWLFVSCTEVAGQSSVVIQFLSEG